MSQLSSKAPASSYPEFAVRRETISSFFHPPLASSTFHDLVTKGKIVPLKGLKGFYRLNDSLRRLGLREVASVPSVIARTAEDIVRLAFTLIDPEIFPAPPWMLREEDLNLNDADHARLIADQHAEAVSNFGSAVEKLSYFSGVVDAQVTLEAEVKGH